MDETSGGADVRVTIRAALGLEPVPSYVESDAPHDQRSAASAVEPANPMGSTPPVVTVPDPRA